MVEVKRRRGESFESMLRRFSRRLQLSGKIRHAKKIRFHAGKKNETELKKSALRRVELQREYDKLKKLGKLPEETMKRGRR
ncbi:hypothetical protein A3B21_02320 [Candidatus Uhrbacteria bacterium RIFCSPLOWO2_01_FULL_47_24]|uniref:30S ribosomal protein S21 n=1 Tax=Candidatus Uhrbacteria bacterium RIFCSPLOWO2_01_FULL_47_24 TaxID=1802401 RepID=A0A1F7UPJ2_9BACT|nr:MAG: hypothetical protein A2753_04145 [Candidatus Uhrbacteria bacterium RIFCSPHIGHO2_01_FULL_47_11]OGL68094.1 MAG: hypothetical protein A3D58_00800 [Candidatus Uhrbacteria bacterium RIFCSPHIGHO2_02_FULL_46_47]OGL75468.1 MAG: hypothetical protein A3F52_05530 [Candidatus Uhrbacteria bacterium RIFCSPHIGHO2_12_FULL_47_11]OGL80186.1 MAG: hypothetical protein A3B21_02320 [Candidatus Uhrbacteria bacterium RIFCSPLOWO2_01_FULL_47_24]OGL84972.1 MAG: hypothetical protein A3J03_04705 [Candidatus Uhrbact